MQKKRIIAIILAVVMLVTTANFMPKYVKAEEAEDNVASNTDAQSQSEDMDTQSGVAGAIQDEIPIMRLQPGGVGTVKVTGLNTASHSGTTFSSFALSNGCIGFCTNHAARPIGQNASEINTYDYAYFDLASSQVGLSVGQQSQIKKILYYGYNGLANQLTGYSANEQIAYTTDAMQYVISGRSYISGNPLFGYINDGWAEPPSPNMSFSPSNATSFYSTQLGKQRTQSISFNADSRVGSDVTLPAGMELYFTSSVSGKTLNTAYTGTVRITGGDTFYITMQADADMNWTGTVSGQFINGIYEVHSDSWSRSGSGVQGIMFASTGFNSASFTVTFTQQNGTVAVQKSSSNPTVTNGNTCYSLKDAVYKIYKTVVDAQSNSNVVATLITDENGYAMASDIPLGSYVIKETQPPKGYALDSNIYSVTITANHTTTAPCILNVTDRPQMDPTRVLLTKQNENGQALEGAEFTFKYYAEQSDTDPATMGKSSVRTWVLKTNNYGMADLSSKFKVSGDDFYYMDNGDTALPLGTITIQETKAPSGYVIDNTVYVRQITSQGAGEAVTTYNAPILTNKEFRAYLKIIKKDADTGKSLLNNAATFKIWSYEANEYVDFNGISEFKTNDRGELITPDSLPVGRYRIDEYMSPDGYYISEPNKKYDIDVSTSGNYTKYIAENGTVTDMGLFTIEVDNTSVKGYIEIEKSGESYGAYDYNKGKYEISDVALSNVSFKIYANDNIYSTDGHKNLIYSKNELVDVIVTDENGYAISKEIPLGKYIIREDTPSGYVSIPDMEVELSTSSELRDETINSTYHKAYYERVDITNILQKAKISVYKYDENKIYSLAGAEFALYEYNEEYADRESYINSGVKVASGKTDENGKLYFGIFPLGRYVIVETKSPAGYSLSTDISIINAEYDVSAVEYVDITDTWINNVAQGSVKLLKRDLENHDLALNGVKFNLYRRNDDNAANIADIADMIANEQAFDSKTREVINSFKDSADDIFVGEYTTDEDGEINISELPIGEYYFRETEAYSSKYWRTEDVIAFDVEEGKTTTVMVFNDGRVGTLILKGVVMPGSGGGHYVKTGDNFTKNMLLLFLVSGVGVAFFVSKRKEDD